MEDGRQVESWCEDWNQEPQAIKILMTCMGNQHSMEAFMKNLGVHNRLKKYSFLYELLFGSQSVSRHSRWRSPIGFL